MRRFFGANCVSIAALLAFSVLASVFFALIAYGEKVKYDELRASDEAADMLALAGAVSRLARRGDDPEASAEVLIRADMARLSDLAKCGIRDAVRRAEAGEYGAILELDRRISASSKSGGGIGKSIADAIEGCFGVDVRSPLAEYSENGELPSVAPRSLHISELSARNKKYRASFFGDCIKMKHGYTDGGLSASVEYTKNAYFICSVGGDQIAQIWNPAGITGSCLSFTDVENSVSEIVKTVAGGARTLSLVSCGLHGDTVFYSFADGKRAFSAVVGVSADTGEIMFFACGG